MVENRAYYRLQPGETDLANAKLASSKIFLTSERIIEVRGSGGAQDLKVVGLESLDHVHISTRNQNGLLWWAIGLFALGVLAMSFSTGFGGICILISLILVLAYFGSKQHTLVIASNRTEIRTTVTGGAVSAAREMVGAIEQAKQARMAKVVNGRFAAQPPMQVPNPPAADSAVAQLEKLAVLRERGLVTAEEFEWKKRELLGMPLPPR